MTRYRLALLLFPGLLALVALIYLPGLSGPFLFDDIPTIVDNPGIRAQALDLPSLGRAAQSFEPGGAGRPLTMATFAVDHALAGGIDGRQFKRTNVLLHLVNTALIFWLAVRLFALTGLASSSARLAGLAVAAIWALHPLQVSTVLYVVQRMEMLAASFMLLALLAYLRGRTAQISAKRAWPWLVLCVPLIALGVASKETALMLPVFALTLELTVLRFRAADRRVARAWRWAYACACVVAVVAFLAIVLPRYGTLRPEIYRDFNTWERLLTQGRVLVLYLSQFLWPSPSRLTFYYDTFAASNGLLRPWTTLASLLLIAGLVVGAWRLRDKWPLACLGIFFFFAAHLLTSNIIPLELVFEHRNYLALFGLGLVVVDILRRLPAHLGMAKPALLILPIIALAFLGLLRASTWGNPLHLYSEHAQQNPDSARASADLAAHYLVMTDRVPWSPFYGFAIREFERGSLLANASIVPDQGLILTAASIGRTVEDQWWQRLIEKLRTRPIVPDSSGALFSLLRNRLEGIDLDDDRLVEAFLVLFDRVAMPPHSYAQFGEYVLTRVEDQSLADEMFRRAVERSQDYPDYARQIVEVLIRDGHLRQARVALIQARAQGMLQDMDPDALRAMTDNPAAATPVTPGRDQQD